MKPSEPNALKSNGKTSHNAWKNLWALWRESETYIFHSALDAILATIVLLIIPLISLCYVYVGGGTLFSNYGFPFISIIFAALYDSYGRYASIDTTNEIHRKIMHLKLGIRTACNIVSLVVACLICGVSSLKIIWWFPCIPLLLSGILLANEGVQRIKASFLLAFGGW